MWPSRLAWHPATDSKTQRRRRREDKQSILTVVKRFIERQNGAVITLLLVGFVSLYGVMLIQLRAEAWDRSIASADNLLRSIVDNVTQSVERYESTLEVLSREFENAEHNKLAGGHERIAISAHATLLSSTGDLFLFDANGEIQERSRRFNARAAIGRRDFLAIHKRETSTAVLVGQPFLDPLSGDAVLWVSRRLERADGRFAGVIAGTLHAGRWREPFESFSIGPRSSINLFHVDGMLMMRAPFLADRIGTSLAATPAFQQFTGATSGTFVARAAIDGEERAYHFAHLKGLPLIANVATSTREIYADWWRGAWLSGGIVALLAGLAIGLRRILSRELHLRRESEARYRILSDLDGLTGIANRRRFNEALVEEWNLALESGSPLSTILLDVDRFKLFNDRYGHQAGDECLCAVAAAIVKAVGRSADTVARFGGEEFIILLPGTDAAGCLVVAERIRAAVEELRLIHLGNPEAGVVTVSLGTATATPRTEQMATASLLVSAADRALYRAKHRGRNRVEQDAHLPSDPEPPLLHDEAQRLEAVETRRSALSISDRQAFDELAETAAKAFHAPLAFVSLVGSDRQTFIGKSGSDADGTPRDLSFCAHAIAGTGVLVVPDATNDPRFATNPLVTGDMNVRFYAGAPIVDAERGQPLGAVCVIDTVPRDAISPHQEQLLKSLADLVVLRLGNQAPVISSRLADRTAGLKRSQ